jgi:hypothetical protein
MGNDTVCPKDRHAPINIKEKFMKWQKALTKKQLAHMREWQDTLTLRDFKKLRIAQREMERNSAARGHFSISCHDCNEIERRLREKEVKLGEII